MKLTKYKKNKQTIMLKPILAKLHSFINDFILLMEEELEELKYEKTKDSLNLKKNIAEILNKLITFLTQLNRISKEEQEEEVLPEEDKEIINRFLNKHIKIIK